MCKVRGKELSHAPSTDDDELVCCAAASDRGAQYLWPSGPKFECALYDQDKARTRDDRAEWHEARVQEIEYQDGDGYAHRRFRECEHILDRREVPIPPVHVETYVEQDL